MSQCTLFSNHGHVLLVLADDPEARLRDVAERIGITERAVQKIVRDLQDDGLLAISKHGRRNRYRIHLRKALHHPLEAHRTVGHLIDMMKGPAASPPATAPVIAPAPAEAEAPARQPARQAKAASPAPEAGGESTARDETPQVSTPPAPKPRAGRKKKTGPPSGDQQGSLF